MTAGGSRTAADPPRIAGRKTLRPAGASGRATPSLRRQQGDIARHHPLREQRKGGSSSTPIGGPVWTPIDRLENEIGVRLLNRTTRNVNATEAGLRLLDRLGPAFGEIEAALGALSDFRDRPAGPLRLNVPASAVRLVLPRTVPPFLAAFPDVELEIITDESLVDLVASGCDAGIRYDERLEQDMIAVPIGPRVQRFAAAAASAYLDRTSRPKHPRDLLSHACLRSRFAGRSVIPWEFERGGETVRIDPSGPLVVTAGAATDLAVEAAVGGAGVIFLFEDWLRPHLESGALEPVLEPWWQSFSGPFLYYPSRRLVPTPLRAFIDFVKANPGG